MKLDMRQGIPALIVCSGLLVGAGPAMATGTIERSVEQLCANQGRPVSLTCTSCHDDGDGGSGAGRNAARGNNATIIAFFCPAPVIPDPVCTDRDGDGFFAETGCGTPVDFNDRNAAAFPGAAEICNDGVDNDGNGLADLSDPVCDVPPNCTDRDGDGFNIEGGDCGPMDCNDNDVSVNPGAVEDCTDGIDNNCNGRVDSADINAVGCPLDCTDNDGDGFAVEGGACGPIDCDDGNMAVNPASLEVCDDGVDNNCDNAADAQDNFCREPGGGDIDNDDDDERPWWRNRDGDDNDRDDDRDDDTDRNRNRGDDDGDRRSRRGRDND